MYTYQTLLSSDVADLERGRPGSFTQCRHLYVPLCSRLVRAIEEDVGCRAMPWPWVPLLPWDERIENADALSPTEHAHMWDRDQATRQHFYLWWCDGSMGRDNAAFYLDIESPVASLLHFVGQTSQDRWTRVRLLMNHLPYLGWGATTVDHRDEWLWIGFDDSRESAWRKLRNRLVRSGEHVGMFRAAPDGGACAMRVTE